MDADEPLLLFRAQYLQCVDHDFLPWPPPALLKQPDAQRFLYKRLFDPVTLHYRPSASYEAKVLRTLLAKIERSLGLDTPLCQAGQDLMSRLLELDSKPVRASNLAQQDAFIAYNCASSLNVWNPVVLYEARSMISGSSFTGHRTWDGALHLASYLLVNSWLVNGKCVLELGAGTGFLSILCCKYLGARQVIATDGDEKVVEKMLGNLQLNGLKDDDASKARRLCWGAELLGNWVEKTGQTDFDVVIAADVIYQKESAAELVQALRALLDMRPNAKIILSNVVRFPHVFDAFRQNCERARLELHHVQHQMILPSRQKALFYSTAMPLEIIEVKDS